MEAIEQTAVTHVTDEDLRAQFSAARERLAYLAGRGSYDTREEQGRLQETIDSVGEQLMQRAGVVFAEEAA